MAKSEELARAKEAIAYLEKMDGRWRWGKWVFVGMAVLAFGVSISSVLMSQRASDRLTAQAETEPLTARQVRNAILAGNDAVFYHTLSVANAVVGGIAVAFAVSQWRGDRRGFLLLWMGRAWLDSQEKGGTDMDG